MFIRWPNNCRDFYWILICWFIKLSVRMFLPLIVIYSRGNFVSSLGMYLNLTAIVLSIYIPILKQVCTNQSKFNKSTHSFKATNKRIIKLWVHKLQNSYDKDKSNKENKNIVLPFIYFQQGSKGIRQWPINWCSSLMTMHKN